MTKYILNNGVLLGDKVFPSGTVFEGKDLENFDVEGYLERGSMSEYDPSEAETETATETVPETPEVVTEDPAAPEVPTPQVTPVTDPTPEQIEEDLKNLDA